MVQGGVAIAFVGKQNEPLFFLAPEEADVNDSLHLQMIVHSALDVVDEKKKKLTQQNDGFLGHLLSMDDYKVYGSCTYTQTKTILICDFSVSEATARDTLTAAMAAYTAAIQNPFQPTGQAVLSSRFAAQIASLLIK